VLSAVLCRVHVCGMLLIGHMGNTDAELRAPVFEFGYRGVSGLTDNLLMDRNGQLSARQCVLLRTVMRRGKMIFFHSV